MSCKNCIHYEVCNDWSINDSGESLDITSFKVCNTFKNKLRYTESPCNFGDIVYVLDYENESPIDYSGYIFIMSNNDFAFLSPVLNGESNHIEICNEYFQRYINETDNSGIIIPLSELFLTKEEAERNLEMQIKKLNV